MSDGHIVCYAVSVLCKSSSFTNTVFSSCLHSVLQIIKVVVDGPPAVCSSSLKGQWSMPHMDREDFVIYRSWYLSSNKAERTLSR